jgi:hypothetical protein
VHFNIVSFGSAESCVFADSMPVSARVCDVHRACACMCTPPPTPLQATKEYIDKALQFVSGLRALEGAGDLYRVRTGGMWCVVCRTAV